MRLADYHFTSYDQHINITLTNVRYTVDVHPFCCKPTHFRTNRGNRNRQMRMENIAVSSEFFWLSSMVNLSFCLIEFKLF